MVTVTVVGHTSLLPLCIAARPAVDGDRHDGRPGLQRHDEAALLERQQLARARACAFREDQERVAGAQGLRALRTDAIAASRLARSTGTNSPRMNTRPSSGSFDNSAL